MRSLYVIIIALLALTGGGLLVGERLLESEVSLQRVERLLQQKLGKPTDLRGPIEVDFFPAPQFSIGKIVVGNPVAADENWVLSVDRTDLGVGLLSMLGGDLDVRSIRLIRPALVVRDGSYPKMADDAGPLDTLDKLAEMPVVMIDASMSVMRLDHELALHSIQWRSSPRANNAGADIQLDVTMLDQRVAANLQSRIGDRDGFRSIAGDINAGIGARLLNMTIRSNVAIDSRGEWEVSGDIEAASAAPEALSEIADTVFGHHQPLPSGLFDNELAVSGTGSWKQGVLSFEDTVIRAFNGKTVVNGTIDHGRFEIDAASDGVALPDDAMTRLKAIRGHIQRWRPMSGEFRGRLRNTIWHERKFPDTTVTITQDANETAEISLNVDLPGSGRAAFDGLLAWHDELPEFDGTLDANSQNLSGLASWFGKVGDEGMELPFARAGLRTKLKASSSIWTLTDLDARLDASRISGSVALAVNGRVSLAADLSADRLDLDSFLSPDGSDGQDLGPQADALLERWKNQITQAVKTDWDLAVQFEARRVRFEGETITGVSLEAHADAQDLLIRQMHIESLYGGKADLTAEIDRQSGTGELVLDWQVDRPARFARVLGLPAPAVLSGMGPLMVSTRLVGSPQDFRFDLDMENRAIAMNASGTSHSLRLIDADIQSLVLETERFEDITRLLGQTVNDRRLLRRPFRLTWGDAETEKQQKLSIRLDQAEIVSTIQYDNDPRPKITGSVDIQAIDPVLLAEIEHQFEHRADVRIVDPVAWLGNWPTTALDPLLIGPFSTHLRINIATDARSDPWFQTTIRHEPGQWIIEDLNASFEDLEVSGSFSVEEHGTGQLTSAYISISNANFRDIGSKLKIESDMDVNISVEAEFTGFGHTADQWIRSLKGRGNIAFSPESASNDRPNLPELNHEFVLSQGIAALTPTLAADGVRMLPELSLDLYAWMISGLYRDLENNADVRLFGPVTSPTITIFPDDSRYEWGLGPGGP